MGTDYSQYQRMEVKIKYQGDNQRLRMSMHNFYPTNPKSGNRETLKGLDVSFMAEETQGVIVIYNYGSKSSKGWTSLNKMLRRMPDDQTDSIVDIGIDLVPPIAEGEHRIQLVYIDVYGELLPAETWYLGVALLWLISNLLFISRHLFQQEMRIRNDSKRLSMLANYSDDLQQESQKYKTLSNTDLLTGALNRNGFAAEMSQHSPDEKIAHNTTLMVIDLDNFKRINDRLGHDTGDAVLRETAQMINKNIRVTDRFVRWGGEEFILLCDNTNTNTNTKQALLIGEKIRAAVESMKLNFQDAQITITVSIGLGVVDSPESFDDLFQRTDQALYRAKHLGRNCIVLSEPES